MNVNNLPAALHQHLDTENDGIIGIKNSELVKLKQKIKKIKVFFVYEVQQVDTIIDIIWSSKKICPLGLTFVEIIDEINQRSKFFLYKSNAYLRSLLNLLKEKPIGILELSSETCRFNLTKFGLDYYLGIGEVYF